VAFIALSAAPSTSFLRAASGARTIATRGDPDARGPLHRALTALIVILAAAGLATFPKGGAVGEYPPPPPASRA
jgi:hypothetical protein